MVRRIAENDPQHQEWNYDMNALVPVSSTMNALVPHTMDEAIRLAELMARAKMVPKHLHDDVGTCFLIVEQALRWQMSPFAVAQCTSNIGGKLMWEGKLIAAAASSCGAITGEFDYQFEGDPKNPETLSVIASATRASDGQVRTMKLSWLDAKTDNQFWKKQPEQQLSYAVARVWCRRWTPGVILGVFAPEEFNKVDTFNGTTIDHAEAEAPPSPPTRRDAINEAVPLRTTTTPPPNGKKRHSVAPPPGAPDADWRACLDWVAPALAKLRTRATVVEVGNGPTCSDIIANGPEWARAELSQLLADNYGRFPEPEEPTPTATPGTEAELPEVEIAGEAKMASGDD